MSLPWKVGFWGGESQRKMGLQCGNDDLFLILLASYWARHLRASVSMIKKNRNLLLSSQFLVDEWRWLRSAEG